MSGIDITPSGPHEYGVRVSQNGETTSHRVIVPQTLLSGWNVDGTHEEAVVRESFHFLLEREPASSILPEFSLAIIARYFPEYSQELPKRLAQ